jgi:hypothetical protein
MGQGLDKLSTGQSGNGMCVFVLLCTLIRQVCCCCGCRCSCISQRTARICAKGVDTDEKQPFPKDSGMCAPGVYECYWPHCTPTTVHARARVCVCVCVCLFQIYCCQHASSHVYHCRRAVLWSRCTLVEVEERQQTCCNRRNRVLTQSGELLA